MYRSVITILLNHTLFAKKMIFRFYMNLKPVINGVPFCHIIVCRVLRWKLTKFNVSLLMLINAQSRGQLRVKTVVIDPSSGKLSFAGNHLRRCYLLSRLYSK